MTMHQKMEVLIFLILNKNGSFWKKSSLTILFTSIDFSSLHFFSLHLSSKISASNGGEEEDILFCF
jgi:hypothetical protein